MMEKWRLTLSFWRRSSSSDIFQGWLSSVSPCDDFSIQSAVHLLNSTMLKQRNQVTQCRNTQLA